MDQHISIATPIFVNRSTDHAKSGNLKFCPKGPPEEELEESASHHVLVGEIQRFPEESRTSSSKSQRDSRAVGNGDILKSNISFGLTNFVVKVEHLYHFRTGLSLKKICFKYRGPAHIDSDTYIRQKVDGSCKIWKPEILPEGTPRGRGRRVLRTTWK